MGDAVIEEINKEAKWDLVGAPNETQWKRSFRNLEMMNTLQSKTLEDVGVSDQMEGNYSSCKNIAVEVNKICTLLRETQYLENATDFRPHLRLGTNIELSVTLVKFYEVVFANLRENLPKILKSEPSNINVIYSTLDEESEKKKIDNCTISQIKSRIVSLLENFINKNMWTEMYKAEVVGKTKIKHVEFYKHLLEIYEDTIN